MVSRHEREPTPGAEARVLWRRNAKAEALAHLEAKQIPFGNGRKKGKRSMRFACAKQALAIWF
jgi:hypothetical protein